MEISLTIHIPEKLLSALSKFPQNEVAEEIANALDCYIHEQFFPMEFDTLIEHVETHLQDQD